jgi:hypothetical protein
VLLSPKNLLTRARMRLISCSYHHMQPLSKIQLYRFSAVCSLALMLSPKGNSLPVIGRWTDSAAVSRADNSDSLRIQPTTDAMPRRGCDLLKSVIAYLNWRVESARVPFVSWRNQPAEVGCLTHAINLCNQALSDPRPAYDAEREQLNAELGTLLRKAIESANGLRAAEAVPDSSAALDFPPKKPVRSEKLKRGSAAA